MVCALMWILFSDSVVHGLFDDPVMVGGIQTFKGIGFVLVSAMFLYFLISRGQKNLRESSLKAIQHQQSFEVLINKSPYAIAVHNNGEVVFVNKALLEMFDISTSDRLLGKPFTDLIKIDLGKQSEEQMRTLLEGDSNKTPLQVKYVKPDGNTLDVELMSSKITYDGEPAVQVVITDITGRKRREELIERTLEEKTILLSEVHHRVKNNMAIISWLMELQSYEIEDKKLKGILYDSIGRIKSIAVIHEEMYDSQHLNRIRFYNNIRSLVSNVSKQYTGVCNISFEFALEEIELNVNQAVPCALFLNEAVTNVFKHAYKNGEGDCLIEFKRQGDQIHLRVQDYGEIETPRALLKEDRKLGMNLMQMMGDQLMGAFEVEQQSTGVTVLLMFDEESKRKGSVANVKVIE